MTANLLLKLNPLTVASTHPETAESVRRLTGAHDSIQGLFTTLHSLRDTKVKAGISIARLSHSEVDLLRAALVFAGAGLDAVLKQLIRDALPNLLLGHSPAQGNLRLYSGRLTANEPAKAKAILMDADPTARLQGQYLDDLTRGSLQGHGELEGVRKALGLPDAGALSTATLATFAVFFTSRNEVVHELDLIKPTGKGTFTRRYRRMDETLDQADAALRLSGDFIAGVDGLL